MSVEPELEVADALTRGREALSRGEWEQAQAYFEAAHDQGESAEATEALAMAAWWLDDAPLTIESRSGPTVSTVNGPMLPARLGWPSGSLGTIWRFAASPQLGGAGFSEHSVYWTASTPYRSTDG